MERPTKVLVIDEDQEFIAGCSKTFNGNLYQLHFVSTRQQAQQIINGGFNLILIGTLSPAGESFMLQQWIKRHPVYRFIPVLVIDACFHERRWKGWRVFEGLQIDAEEYVSKPLEAVELLPVIEKLCTNVINDEQQQIIETLWQAYLSLGKKDRETFTNRILQIRT
jgi:CheY-like chemotaxis protein